MKAGRRLYCRWYSVVRREISARSTTAVEPIKMRKRLGMPTGGCGNRVPSSQGTIAEREAEVGCTVQKRPVSSHLLSYVLMAPPFLTELQLHLYHLLLCIYARVQRGVKGNSQLFLDCYIMHNGCRRARHGPWGSRCTCSTPSFRKKRLSSTFFLSRPVVKITLRGESKDVRLLTAIKGHHLVEADGARDLPIPVQDQEIHRAVGNARRHVVGKDWYPAPRRQAKRWHWRVRFTVAGD